MRKSGKTSTMSRLLKASLGVAFAAGFSVGVVSESFAQSKPSGGSSSSGHSNRGGGGGGLLGVGIGIGTGGFEGTANAEQGGGGDKPPPTSGKKKKQESKKKIKKVLGKNCDQVRIKYLNKCETSKETEAVKKGGGCKSYAEGFANMCRNNVPGF